MRTNPIPVTFDPTEDAEAYDLTVEKDGADSSGYPTYVFQGEYDNLMAFMTTELSMTSSEADIEIGDEDDFDHSEDHFRDAQENWDELRNARTTPTGRAFEARVRQSPHLTQDEVFQAFEELIGSGSEMDAAQAADFISQQNGMDREQVYAILKADEDEFAGAETSAGDPAWLKDVPKLRQENMMPASLAEAGMPLSETKFAGLWNDVTQVQVGDKVDVYLPDSFMTAATGVRVIELVDDVEKAVGVPPEEETEDFKGPGFVGDSEDEGQMVFSLHQIVPGSKEKYASLMDDDPYMSQQNYDRLDYEGDPATVSDYYNDDDTRAAVPFRAPGAVWREGASFNKFMDKILVQEAPSKKLLVENDSAQRQRAARHQERPLSRTVYGRKR